MVTALTIACRYGRSDVFLVGEAVTFRRHDSLVKVGEVSGDQKIRGLVLL